MPLAQNKTLRVVGGSPRTTAVEQGFRQIAMPYSTV